MIAGILSMAVIVLTQSFYEPTETSFKKVKTEKNKDQSQQGDQVFVSAPSDLANHGTTQIVDNHSSPVAEKANHTTESNPAVVLIKKTAIRFFQTLFRVIIAPNAP